MANINLAQNTYAGILYAEYLTPAILAPKGLVDRGLVTGIESVKNKVTLRGVNRVIDFQTPAATFNAQSGDVSLDEKQLTMVPYEVMDQIDAELLRTTWESEQQGRGSFEDYKLTPELYNFLLERIYVPRMAIGNEQLYILGKAGVNAGEVATASFSATYAGLLPTIAADAGVRKLQLPESAKEAITGIANGAAGAATITIGATNDVQVGDEVTVVGADGNQTSGGVSINGQTFVVLAKNAGVLTVDKAIAGATPAT